MTMMRELKYVPCSNRTLYRYLDMDATGLPIEDSPWNGGSGAPPLLTDNDLKEFVAMCRNKNRGMTYCSAAVKKFILSKKKEKLRALGFAADIVPPFPPSLVDC